MRRAEHRDGRKAAPGRAAACRRGGGRRAAAAAAHRYREPPRRGGGHHRWSGPAMDAVADGDDMAAPRHFLDIDRVDAAELRRMLDHGLAYKRGIDRSQPLQGKMLAMIFEKPSTRTRLSFEVAMKQLGGDCVVMSSSDSQLSRGETAADTARVLSRYVDAIMIRTTQAAKLEELAQHATVPVINGLTDASHPCQLMADVMTLEEHKGAAAGKIVAWSGDGN